MVLTLGLSSPVPRTTKTSPRKKANVLGTAIVKWPRAMIQPPTHTALRCPQRLSATQPPGSAMM